MRDKTIRFTIRAADLLRTATGHQQRAAGCGSHKDRRPNRQSRSTQKTRLRRDVDG